MQPLDGLNTTDLSDKVFKLSTALTQAAVVRAIENGDGLGGGTYVASCVGAGALAALAPMLANHERYDDETARKLANSPEGPKQMLRLVTPERLRFVALICSYAYKVVDAETGDIQTQSGPNVLWAALQDWQKLYPDKKADDYFDEAMLKAARDYGTSSAAKFDPELEAKISGVSVPTIRQ